MREIRNSANGKQISVPGTIVSIVFLIVLTFFTGCSKDDSAPLPAKDVTAPVVLSVTPGNNAISVPTSSSATVTFSEGLNAGTVTTSSVTITQGTTVITGTVNCTGKTVTFVPSAGFEAGKTYTGIIKTLVKDLAGNSLASDYTWTFTTAAPADVIAPTVSSVIPAVNATSIAFGVAPSVTFNEAMDQSTLTASTFLLKKGSSVIEGTVTGSGVTATFTPASALMGNTLYTATITTAAKDTAGNPLNANYSWSFTTEIPADVTAPTVSSVTPAANAVSVAADVSPTVTFSETMNQSTITSSTFTLKKGSATVDGTVTVSGTTATFNPATDLEGITVYTARVSTAAKDSAGNALASDYTWNFTTATTVVAKSFSADVVPVLNLCNTCHTHPWTVSSNASTFYTNLVNGGYVKPADPTQSKIYRKIDGGHPSSTVSSTQKKTIITWMLEGSKNN